MQFISKTPNHLSRHIDCDIFNFGSHVVPEVFQGLGVIFVNQVLEISPQEGMRRGYIRIRAHYEKQSKFERGRFIEMKEAGWINRRNARHVDRSDADKNGWKMAEFRFLMVAVDLGPQQIGRTD
ncbi:hypothetical protein TNCV_3743011 [Trichonephila clavipes]|nr:hypothetical protein TNCV_3743011 [Trichonephila clavipes]